MKNSTSFFIVGYLLILAALGIACVPGGTQSQITNSLGVAVFMGYTGLGCFFFYKR